jgi:hypothetical protein
VLAPAAADPVLELNCSFKLFAFSLVGKVFVFGLSCGEWRSTSLLSLYSDCPDKAEQLSSHCGYNLPLILACHSQLRVALVKAILRFPGNFNDLRRNSLLWFT